MKIKKEWLEQELKEYKVPIIGGINRYYYVKAPNKTLARIIANGETNSWVKVKGKIIEVK